MVALDRASVATASCPSNPERFRHTRDLDALAVGQKIARSSGSFAALHSSLKRQGRPVSTALVATRNPDAP